MHRQPIVHCVLLVVAASTGSLLAADPPATQPLNLDQQLMVACHRLDVDGVVAALRAGADANGRFGAGDVMVFRDKWSLGWPMERAAKAWTPLIALASSSRYPDPPREVKNTESDWNWSIEERRRIPPEQLAARDQRAVAIAQILLSHQADLDANDGYGATPLYIACYRKKPELAKLLLRHDAKVNTKTRVYIDGSDNITPLHRATWSAELTKLLLKMGADATAKDSKGHTPADWARLHGEGDDVQAI